MAASASPGEQHISVPWHLPKLTLGLDLEVTLGDGNKLHDGDGRGVAEVEDTKLGWPVLCSAEAGAFLCRVQEQNTREDEAPPTSSNDRSSSPAEIGNEEEGSGEEERLFQNSVKTDLERTRAVKSTLEDLREAGVIRKEFANDSYEELFPADAMLDRSGDGESIPSRGRTLANSSGKRPKFDGGFGGEKEAEDSGDNETTCCCWSVQLKWRALAANAPSSVAHNVVPGYSLPRYPSSTHSRTRVCTVDASLFLGKFFGDRSGKSLGQSRRTPADFPQILWGELRRVLHFTVDVVFKQLFLSARSQSPAAFQAHFSLKERLRRSIVAVGALMAENSPEKAGIKATIIAAAGSVFRGKTSQIASLLAQPSDLLALGDPLPLTAENSSEAAAGTHSKPLRFV
ncbi:hypothetical protein KSP40_PGU008578 [Platanthera guangdongensis]|uniref:Uncharacterized protein n=1 Tax=Platanthera guangdongensis TaxID=2320717 RepID=A0ABR2MC16_9ASPA